MGLRWPITSNCLWMGSNDSLRFQELHKTHTCLMDTCIHVVVCRAISGMIDKGKAMGLQKVFLEQSMNNLRSPWQQPQRMVETRLVRFVRGTTSCNHVPRCIPKQVRLQYPNTRLFVGHSLVKGRVAPCSLIQSLTHTHTHGLDGVFTLQATVPLENKAPKGRVEKGEPGCFKKAKQHRELA